MLSLQDEWEDFIHVLVNDDNAEKLIMRVRVAKTEEVSKDESADPDQVRAPVRVCACVRVRACTSVCVFACA